MGWTDLTRRKYRRDRLHHSNHTMHAEWTVFEPHMPPLSASMAMRGRCLAGSAVTAGSGSKQ